MEQQLPFAWEVIRDLAIETIIEADKVIDSDRADLEVRENLHILTFPSIWRRRKTLTQIAKDNGWSETKASIAEATGFILDECAPAEGITPKEIHAKVTKAHKAPGSLGANVYAPVGLYLDACRRDGNSPTVAGAVKAINAEMSSEPSTPKALALREVDSLKARIKGENKRTAVAVDDEIRQAITELYDMVAPATSLVTV